jgi:hypothetical protein
VSAPTYAEQLDLQLLIVREKLKDRAHVIASGPNARFFWIEYLHIKRVLAEIDMIFWTERNTPRVINCLSEANTLVGK